MPFQIEPSERKKVVVVIVIFGLVAVFFAVNILPEIFPSLGFDFDEVREEIRQLDRDILVQKRKAATTLDLGPEHQLALREALETTSNRMLVHRFNNFAIPAEEYLTSIAAMCNVVLSNVEDGGAIAKGLPIEGRRIEVRLSADIYSVLRFIETLQERNPFLAIYELEVVSGVTRGVQNVRLALEWPTWAYDNQVNELRNKLRQTPDEEPVLESGVEQ